MQIDTVVYFQITDPKMYTYGVERPISAIENLTATTLRNIIGDSVRTAAWPVCIYGKSPAVRYRVCAIMRL